MMVQQSDVFRIVLGDIDGLIIVYQNIVIVTIIANKTQHDTLH